MEQKKIITYAAIIMGILLFFAGALLYRQHINLYRYVVSLEEEQQALYEHVSTPKYEKVVEKVMTGSQIWRQIQDLAQDTVVQVFTQIAAIDILQPFKTPKQGSAYGSGFFINDDGDIVTNAHVVAQARSVWIQIPSLGKRIIDVEVVSISPERDLALLRVKGDGIEVIRQELGSIPYLQLGDSDLVRRSDEVLALGYPLGQQSLKSTTGVVSGREQNFVQTSAPINPGSSGGPLVNNKGEVIGINSAGITQAQNIGYAIPVNDLKIALLDFYKVQILRKPFLGVLFANANASLTEYLGNPQPGGCYIVEVVKGSTLERAGIEPGDMIYELDGYRIDVYGEMTVPWSEDKLSITHYPARLTIGQEVDILVYRKGKKIELKAEVNLTQLPAIKQVYPGYENIDYEIFGGIVVMELNMNHIHLLAEHASGLSHYAELQHRAEPVLVITHMFADTQIFRSRTIGIGTTIGEVNGIAVNTLEEYRQSVRKGIHNEFFTLKVTDNVSRASDNIFVVLPMIKVLEEEPMLARDYRYRMTPFTKDLLRVINMGKQSKTLS